ncbi:TetR/AcrR family transcriptional regulator [Pseudonocardia ailaonensis]|uniref:TetR/AcrR family transcriptional regulator n=1 Tax=Pseudonocardia ailaonensis TaxID=367279 RepID=A0ABN2N8I8_9PSEU
MAGAQTERIVGAAAHLFARKGFAAVSMTDIADSVNLTAGNLYRYLTGKTALLHEVFAAALTVCEADRRPRGLDDLVAVSVDAAATDTAVVMTYLRERSLIDAEAYPDVARRDRVFVEQWRAAVEDAAPGPAPDIEARLYATLGAIDAVAQLAAGPGGAGGAGGAGVHGRRSIGAGLKAMIEAPPAPAAAPAPDRSPTWRPPVTRRQQIIDASVTLFGERGYHSVRVSDVGKAVGIAGPSVYEHFRTKHDILLATFDRCAGLLANASLTALDGAEGPAEAMDRLVRALAATGVANREAMTMASREIHSLDETHFERVNQFVVDTDELWAAVLREVWPALPARTSRSIARTAVQMTMHGARVPGGPGRAGEVAATTLAFLTAAATHAAAVENDE